MPTPLPTRGTQPDRPHPAPVPPRLSQPEAAGRAAEARADLVSVAAALLAGLAVALAVLWRSLV
ncbi:hypothetical protein [Phreatobacter sp.]|uniref:hypothetical protein n=1 Tax=Phreatobacter sp. TaxID=1966341 RepID=UPI003F6F1B20